MQETEGVIKYKLHHTPSKNTVQFDIQAINTWRTIMYQLGLIGQQASRYQGYGYGNISQRIQGEQFLISGTQTGGIATLSSQDYCIVESSNLDTNSLFSSGPCQPSSEALSHASVYAQDSTILCIIHAHSPEIWQATQTLRLASTA